MEIAHEIAIERRLRLVRQAARRRIGNRNGRTGDKFDFALIDDIGGVAQCGRLQMHRDDIGIGLPARRAILRPGDCGIVEDDAVIGVTQDQPRTAGDVKIHVVRARIFRVRRQVGHSQTLGRSWETSGSSRFVLSHPDDAHDKRQFAMLRQVRDRLVGG
jgi:hypothetical protein